MPNGFKIASAWVSVEPDMTGFSDKLRGAIAEERDMLKIPVSLDSSGVRADADKIGEQIRARSPLNFRTEADNPIDDAFVAKVQASVRSISADALKIKATPDTAEFRAKLDATLKELSAVDKAKIPVDVADAAAYRAKVQALADTTAASVKQQIKVEPDVKQAQQAGGLLASAIGLGIVAGLPAIGAATVAAGGAAFAGLAVLIEKNNEQVKGAFVTLENTVNSEMKAAAAQTVPFITAAIGNLRVEFDSLGPQMRTAMEYAGPAIVTLTTGLDRLATNAMPGLVDAARQSGPVMQGAAGLMATLGTTAGNLFTGLSQHSHDFQMAFQTTGTLVQSVGSVLTSIIGMAASAWAAHGPQIVGAIQGILSALSGVASGAIPAFVGGIGGIVGALSHLVSALGPVEPLVGAAVGMFGVWKVATQTLGPVFESAGSKVEALGTKISGLNNPLSKTGGMVSAFGSGVSSLSTALPILSVVLTGISALGEQLYGTQSSFEQALQTGGQAFDDAIAKAKRAQQQQQDITNGVTFFFANVSKGWDQVTGQVYPSLDNLLSKLDAVQYAQYAYDTAVSASGVNSRQAIDAMNGLGAAYLQTGQAQQAVTEYTDMYTAAVKNFGPNSAQARDASQGLATAQQELATNTAIANRAITPAAAYTQEWATNAGVLANNLSTAANAASAMTKQIDLMTHHGLDLQQATDTANQAILQLQNAVKQNTDGLKGHAAALVEDTGFINTATAAGHDLNSWLTTAVTGYSDLVTATYQHAKATGETDKQALADATTAGQGFVTNLDNQLHALGLTQAQIDRVNQAYGLTPKNISTFFSNNAPQAQAPVDNLGRSIRGTPGSWWTAFGSNGDQMIGKALDVGRAVRSVPTFWQTTFTSLMGHAAGGIDVHRFADGGVVSSVPARGLAPMTPIAQVVPPNTMRVVGDRTDVDEAYIPLDGSPRSRAILGEATRRMGSDGAAAPSTVNNWNITTQDPYQAAQLVAAQQSWNNMIGAH